VRDNSKTRHGHRLSLHGTAHCTLWHILLIHAHNLHGAAAEPLWTE
jgi:hypothetical protein